MVSFEPEDLLDGRIRKVYADMRGGARTRQQRILKVPLADLVARMAKSNDSMEE
jgi:hypothetical protein